MTDPVNDRIVDVNECCGNCLCFLPLNEGVGLCRRNPPTVFVNMVPEAGAAILSPGARPKLTPQPMSQYPIVPPNWWCFEHKDPAEYGIGDDQGGDTGVTSRAPGDA